MSSSPVRMLEDGIAISVRVTPKSAHARIDGVGEDAEGRSHLRLRVTEAPEKGKANEALIALLAKTWGMPRSSVKILQGGTSKIKTLLLTQPPENIEEILLQN